MRSQLFGLLFANGFDLFLQLSDSLQIPSFEVLVGLLEYLLLCFCRFALPLGIEPFLSLLELFQLVLRCSNPCSEVLQLLLVFAVSKVLLLLPLNEDQSIKSRALTLRLQQLSFDFLALLLAIRLPLLPDGYLFVTLFNNVVDLHLRLQLLINEVLVDVLDFCDVGFRFLIQLDRRDKLLLGLCNLCLQMFNHVSVIHALCIHGFGLRISCFLIFCTRRFQLLGFAFYFSIFKFNLQSSFLCPFDR